ncbi:MAG TPA: dihydrodipicolinate synthase family protein, partial [bacterium]|nr:dihydrodipicolinate synthase family protein [bacterium]
MSRSLHGIVTPLVTPLTPEGRLDVHGLERLITHVLAGGVHGLFPLGTTGEAYALEPALRQEVVRQTVRIVAGRVPVYVGIGDATVGRTLALGEQAAELGADYLVLISPTYYDYSTDEKAAYFADLSARLPRPVLLYNNPGVTRNPITPSVVAQLLEARNIVGVKDSSG